MRLLTTLVILAVVPCLAGEKQSDLVKSQNGFSISFYHQLAKKSSGNICVSPYSISNVFAMVYMGAKGITAKELNTVFHFPEGEPEELAKGMGALNKSLQDDKSVKLRLANSLWMQDGYKFKPVYRRHCEIDLGARTEILDFRKTKDAAKSINKWFYEKTDRMLYRVVQTGDLVPETKLVLANAVYFHGKWQSPFDRSDTRTEHFYAEYNGKKRDVLVPMMTQEDWFSYVDHRSLEQGTKVPRFKVLSMRYRGDKSMWIILPAPYVKITDVAERLFTPKGISWIGENLSFSGVKVWLPRLRLRPSSLDLRPVLYEMGVKRVFLQHKADLSGIDGSRKLFVGVARQQTALDVSETGTKAAAGTFGGAFGGEPPSGPKRFFATRPFLFLIRDDKTGLILFIGRVVLPSPSKPVAESK